ncbi:MAG TPA: hypothetical protein ENJ82_12025 [Bacteroidetes bacterium]|nr:hypothetical protein [Bacteroidota bacterium]
MAKKNVIKLEFDSPVAVIGVASNEKIWKICWGINQKLNLKLATEQQDVMRVKGPETYSDIDSNPDFEFYFMENTFKSNKVSKLAKQFRFWLVIRPAKDELPDVAALLKMLAQIDNISLAHDLSNEKDIKNLLP